MAAGGVACLCVAVATVVFTVLLEIHARRSLPQRAAERLESLLHSEAERLDNRIAPIRAQLYLMLDWLGTGPAAPSDPEALVGLCLPILARTPALESIRVAHGSGTEWMLSREDLGWLTRWVDEESGTRRSTWTRWDSDGVPIAREDRGSTAYDPRRSAWYRGAAAQLEAWYLHPEQKDPELYWGAETWDAPADKLRFYLSLARRSGASDLVVCFELRPEPLLRSECLCLAPDGSLLSAPAGMDAATASALAGLSDDGATTAAIRSGSIGAQQRWILAAPYPLSPTTSVALVAHAVSGQLRSVEDGLQRAALLASPAAMVVLAIMLRLLEGLSARKQGAQQSTSLLSPEGVQSLLDPPQAYLQALDSARKQTRRLRAELEAQQRSQDTLDAHWRDAVSRIETGREALFALLAADAPWQGAPASTLDQFVEAAAQTLVLDRCSVWRLESNAERLTCVAITGMKAQELPSPLHRADHPMFFLAIEVESVVCSRDAANDPRLAGLVGGKGLHPPGSRGAGDAKRAVLAAPIRLGTRLFGVLLFERNGLWRAWEADEAAFAQGLTQLLALRFSLH